MSNEPDISVVIPAKNSEKVIANQMRALLTQKSSRMLELIVADNGSSDETAAIVSELAKLDGRVRLVDASGKPGVSFARNEGIKESRGRYILLCDSDDLVHPDWIEAFAHSFDLGASFVGGSSIWLTTKGEFLKNEASVFVNDWGPSSVAGCNSGFTKELFETIGGFDETMVNGAEDDDFAFRAGYAGYEAKYVEAAKLNYFQDATPNAVAVKYFRYGQGLAELESRHISHGYPRRSLLKTLGAIAIESIALGLSLKKSTSGRYQSMVRLARNRGYLHAVRTRRRNSTCGKTEDKTAA